MSVLIYPSLMVHLVVHLPGSLYGPWWSFGVVHCRGSVHGPCHVTCSYFWNGSVCD